MPSDSDLPVSDKCFKYRKRVTGSHTYEVIKGEEEIKVNLIITCLILPLCPGCPKSGGHSNHGSGQGQELTNRQRPCPWQGAWSYRDSKVSSNTNNALILWVLS